MTTDLLSGIDSDDCQEKFFNSAEICSPYQLTEIASTDNGFINSVGQEALTAGGATFNVYKLLGVHEQGKLVDISEHGVPLSGGTLPISSLENAFNVYCTTWSSLQKGSEGILESGYLGYDFGVIRLGNGRERYSTETYIQHEITTIDIKQGTNSQNRVTKARVERSMDGEKWYGVDIIELPDNDELNTIHFKGSVPSRWWRIRPLEFNGGDSDAWVVQALKFYNYEATALYNIQDKIFMENRNRDYSDEVLQLKGSYDLLDVTSELSRFGIELPSQRIYMFINFAHCISVLGRPLVIGDILEIPGEAQYTANMEKRLKYVEVTDVGWSTDGYTPGWQPTMLRIVTEPAMATEETQDIFGDLADIVDDGGSVTNSGNPNPAYQDLKIINDSVIAASRDIAPESGADLDIRHFSDEEKQIVQEQAGVENLGKIGSNEQGLYVEDAMPPNGVFFTEGPEYPTNPNDGDYHRLVYVGTAEKVPARLYRYSVIKGRWIYMESDLRAWYNGTKPILQEYLSNAEIRDSDRTLKTDNEEYYEAEYKSDRTRV